MAELTERFGVTEIQVWMKLSVASLKGSLQELDEEITTLVAIADTAEAAAWQAALAVELFTMAIKYQALRRCLYVANSASVP